MQLLTARSLPLQSDSPPQPYGGRAGSVLLQYLTSNALLLLGQCLRRTPCLRRWFRARTHIVLKLWVEVNTFSASVASQMQTDPPVQASAPPLQQQSCSELRGAGFSCRSATAQLQTAPCTISLHFTIYNLTPTFIPNKLMANIYVSAIIFHQFRMVFPGF